VRKALVSQLHSLREDAGPKEIQIIKMTEKLNELEKQYEKSLKAISEKEQHLQQNSTMVHLLHKQVRELRSSLIQRESSLKRAAKLLDEFKYSLQQARFSSRKITTNAVGETTAGGAAGGAGGGGGGGDYSVGGLGEESGFGDSLKKSGSHLFPSRTRHQQQQEVVELISSTPVMEESLQRLHDVLNPHSTSEVCLLLPPLPLLSLPPLPW
jgi:hypothetical protein